MLKNKRLLLGMLVLLLLILPNVVNAQTTNATETTQTSTGKTVNWSYELDGNNAKNLKCTNIASVSGDLEIPSTIDSHNVISLANFAFQDCSGLTSVTIPSSVTSIGSSAFKGCSGLTSIKLSSNLTKLEDLTFQGCTALTEIVLPESLTTIDASLESIGDKNWGMYSPFDGCSALKFIKIPKTVVSIPEGVFSSCKDLTIFAEEGSTAAEYAKSNNINFEKIENWDKRNEILGSDVTAPTVLSMNLKYSNLIGYYNTTTNDYRIPRGVEIVIIVTFNEQITGEKIPTLVIKCGIGENIELKNGTISGKNIVYTYTIQQKDEGLITAVSLTGGNITDLSGNKAVLSVKELKSELVSGYVYADGKTNSTQNNNTNAGTQDITSSKTDTTTATSKLPYTGKVVLAWIIGIITISGAVAYIRYKKLHIK